MAIQQAADYFRQAALADPTILEADLRQGEIVRASKNLEGTYFIRLFAEFETGARQYWDASWGTEPRTVDLLNGLAARCGIPDTQRDNAQIVREYRNSLVHEREEKEEALPIVVARRYLCHFFSFLPQHW
jgi:hypothetical protein